ncbi:MAG TPA: 50S ribosomal protein L24 [Candidatus Saccharimonadales bacterium]|nr:50S ribosomal protein L24 [Candidatus Saccharimonadales bacterium]
MLKFHVGDEVVVTAGKDKGKKGKVDRVFPRESKLVVAGVNMYKRNAKGTSGAKQTGIIDIVKPIGLGNVALVCPKCKLPTRVALVIKNNEKKRVCKKCEQVID